MKKAEAVYYAVVGAICAIGGLFFLHKHAVNEAAGAAYDEGREDGAAIVRFVPVNPIPAGPADEPIAAPAPEVQP